MATAAQVTVRMLKHREVQFAVAVWVAAAALWAAVGPPADATAGLLVAGGMGFWFLSEYPVHRWLLHMPRPPGRFLQGLHHRLHLGHHLEPRREDLVFIPMFVTVPMALIVSGACAAIASDSWRGLQFFLGLWAGLLVYEWVHFSIHAPLATKNRLYRWISKTHTLHHFKNERYWYGVTNPLLDEVFGTNPGTRDVPKSASVKDLGYGDPDAGGP